MNISDLILNRRTHKRFDGTPIEKKQVLDWLEISQFAPNHRRNEPWRFILVDREDLLTFKDKFLNLMPQVLPDLSKEMLKKKMQGTAELIAGAGFLVIVLSEKNKNSNIELENYAAVSCAIHNLTLLAKKDGFDSFWSTNKVLISEKSAPLIGFNPEEFFVAGGIYLGVGVSQLKERKYNLSNKVWDWS